MTGRKNEKQVISEGETAVLGQKDCSLLSPSASAIKTGEWTLTNLL